MSKVIIVGIDFTDTSALTLRQAKRIAQLREAKLILAHVVDSSRLAHFKASLLGGPSDEEVLAVGRRRLAEFAQEHEVSADIEQVVMAGSVADCLDGLVKERDAELLVISANEQKRARLGTIASRCLRQVSCNVMVLRDWHEGHFKKVLVCSDFSATAAQALRRGAMVAKHHKAVLEVIHVMYPPNADSWGAMTSHRMDSEQTYEQACVEKINEQMKQFLENNQTELEGVEVHTEILQSTMPAEEMTYHIQKTGADLVVVGTRTVPKLARIFVGTNAERLLNDAPVSVLATRAVEP